MAHLPWLGKIRTRQSRAHLPWLGRVRTQQSWAHLPWPGKVLTRQSWAHLSWPGRILARCAVGGVLEEVAAAAVEPGAHKTGADSHEPASVAVGWCVPSHSPRTPAPVYVRRARPQDSASLHPSPHLGNVAPSFFKVNAVFASGIVLRTFRFASSRPLRCFSLGTSAPLILSPGMVVRDVALRTFRFAPSLPLRYACGPRPLTAAGGQGPQDNTLTPCNFNPSPPLRYACVPRPLTAAGGQGPQDNTRLRPLHFRSIPLAGRTVHNGHQVPLPPDLHAKQRAGRTPFERPLWHISLLSVE